ncbi:TIGR04104 family putative zinc finger protein [Virgibacillus sediminis]|uniref:TIGR04104 family putative zinc finger protein n=1 Tax=Virgibacillus sediminis TaxID=202260 RepID=A0ABV7A7X5_9BACI
MPVCQQCHSSWSWKETIKKWFSLKNSMACPHCGATQYATARTRKVTSLMNFIAITVIMTMNLFLGPSIMVVIALLLLFPLHLAIYPYILTLSNDEEPLW